MDPHCDISRRDAPRRPVECHACGGAQTEQRRIVSLRGGYVCLECLQAVVNATDGAADAVEGTAVAGRCVACAELRVGAELSTGEAGIVCSQCKPMVAAFLLAAGGG